MKMTVSVNNQSGVPYLQYGTDKQKAKAAKFVKADNKELTKLAYDITNRKHRDCKFNQNVGKAILALPLIGGAVVAATTKGKVSARTIAGAKSFAKIAGAMGIVGTVTVANAGIVNNNKKVAKAEKKHPLLTLAGLTAMATGAVMGAESLVSKISPKATARLKTLGKKVKLDKLAAKMDAAPEAIKKVATTLAAKVTLPKDVKENLGKLSAKIKMPQILKDGYKKVANAEVTKVAISKMTKAGKAMAKNPVTTAAAVIGAAMIAHGVKQSVEASNTKAKLKEAQLKTANQLVNAYAAENESLKMANMRAAESLEKGQAIVNQDTEITDAVN